jgi:hypothetical protein
VLRCRSARLGSVFAAVAILAVARVSHGELTRRGGEIDVRTATGVQPPSLAALPGGGFVVAWSEPISNREAQGAPSAPSRVAAPTSSTAIVLRSHKDVVAAWFDADGQLVRGPVVVNTTPTGETTVNWYVQVASTRDGAVLIAWRQWAARTVLVRLFDAQGNAVSDEIRVNPEPSRYWGDVAATGMSPGQFVVLWNELDDALPYDRHLLAGRSVAPDGSLGDVFSVSPDDSPVHQILPSVVSVDGTKLLATWHDAKGQQTMRARFVGDDPATTAFDIAGALEERRPRVCSLPSGEFVFAWEQYQSAFEGPRIWDRGAWFRRYSAMRQPLSDPLPVLPEYGPTQRMFGFACPPSGNPTILIGYKNALIGRSMDGDTLSTAFQIERANDGATGSLVADADVVSVGSGGLVVTWAQCLDLENDVEPECDLRAQIFSRDGHSPCPGDCNLDGQVTIDELVVAVGIALDSDTGAMRLCLPADHDLDYSVSVSELVSAVAKSLSGC